jgi:Grx4 family monothiol glutaredoxin
MLEARRTRSEYSTCTVRIPVEEEPHFELETTRFFLIYFILPIKHTTNQTHHQPINQSIMPLVKVTSPTLDLAGKTKAVLLFGASWHEGCAPIEAVLTALSATTNDIFVASIDAEAVSELADTYNVTAVPTLIFSNGDAVMKRLEGGVENAQVTVAFQRLLAAPAGQGSVDQPSSTTMAATAVDSEKALTERLDKLIRSDTVMLFMKGVPMAPKCGFSRQVVELLNEHRVPFGCFDILSDDEVRQGLKKHSNWPTYPQIYVNGELQGGLDVMKELAEEGSLAEQWELANTTTTAAMSPEISLQERLSELVKRSDVMIFMKGLPSAPKCGFSRQLIEILDQTGVEYDAFDIFQDEEVREGLKTFSNWPTYPQLYAKGELVGGLDICQELQESDELMEALQQ